MYYSNPEYYHSDPFVEILKRLDRIETKIHDLNSNLKSIAFQTGSKHAELKETESA